MKKFTYWRNAIICEVYVVEAENEDKALDKLHSGECEPVDTEWVDWATGGYELEHIEELDPLYRMVKDYKLVDNC
jgi:hypothetical protein